MNRKLYVSAVLMLCAVAVSAQRRTTYEEYIEKYKHLAIDKQETHGIPASITMAQGLLESDCGNSRLALEGNNHFGIKCKSDWTGMTILHTDDAENECFRKYSSVEESYRDHSEFLDKSPRYQSLFDLDVTDYKGWATGLKAAGYATNPRYADQLIKIIEDYELYMLDSGQALVANVDVVVVEEAPAVSAVEEAVFIPVEKVDVDNYAVSMRTVGNHQVYHNNGAEFIVAREGETMDRLAVAAGIPEKRLRKYNDMAGVTQPRTGDQVYISPKANKAQNGKLIHVVRDGETMHSISQMYGIKLKRLVRINRRSADDRLSAGQQIRLM